MKRPTEADFEVKDKGAAVEVLFRPTNSYFNYYRLADPKDIARFGPVSTEPSGVRHAGPSGDLDDYSAASAEVYAIARRLAAAHASRS